MSNQAITRDEFKKRIVKLLLRSGLTDFPKNVKDQYVLLKSAMLVLRPKAGEMTEKEVNEGLRVWVDNVGQIEAIDHVTLRRALVDTGFLSRSDNGAVYQVSPSGPRLWQFETAVDQVDVLDVLNAAREEMAARKRAYLEKAQKQKNA